VDNINDPDTPIINGNAAHLITTHFQHSLEEFLQNSYYVSCYVSTFVIFFFIISFFDDSGVGGRVPLSLPKSLLLGARLILSTGILLNTLTMAVNSYPQMK